MGDATVDRTFGELVIEPSVLTGTELGEKVGDVVSVFPEEESVVKSAVDTSDMVVLVLESLEVDRLVVSSGVDVPWDAVCEGFEPLGEGEKLDMVTSVCVV